MSHAEQYWIFQQEEPDLIVTGNYKRHKPIGPAWMQLRQVMVDECCGEDNYNDMLQRAAMTEGEKERAQDEFLKQHGIC